MRKIIMTFLLAISLSSANAQYTVLKVIGEVKTEQGLKIIQGTKLKISDKIVWSSPQNKIFAIVHGIGEKIITPNIQSKPKENVFRQVIGTALHTELKTGSFSSMSPADSIPESLKQDPGSNALIVFQAKNYYLFNPKIFPAPNTNFFYLYTERAGEQPTSIKLKTTGDTLVITSKDLSFGIDPSNVSNTLYFYNPNSTPKSDRLAYIRPYFDVENEMEGIIRFSIEEYSKTNKDEAKVHYCVYSNVYFILGKPNMIEFESLFIRYWNNR